MLRSIVLCALCLPVLACSEPPSTPPGQPNIDSETHWMMGCDSDAACGEGASCVCGFCAPLCDAGQMECQTLGGLCVDPGASALGLCAAEIENGLCLPACTRSSDCAQHAEGLVCTSEGVCAPGPPEPIVEDAGLGDASPDDIGVDDVPEEDASTVDVPLEAGDEIIERCTIPEPEGFTNATALGDGAQTPSVVWTGEGFGVIWTRRGESPGLFLSRLDGSGQPDGAALAIEGASTAASAPGLVWTGQDFVAAWIEPDLSQVFMARISAEGEALGEPVGFDTEAQAQSLALAHNPDTGEVALVWAEVQGEGSALSVARLGAQGALATAPLFETGDSKPQPRIEWTGQAYGLVWAEQRPGDAREVYFSRLGPEGEVLAEARLVSSSPRRQDKPANQRPAVEAPRVLWSHGQFAVVWAEDGDRLGGSGIFAMRLDSQGAPLATEIWVTEPDPALPPLVDHRFPTLSHHPGGFTVSSLHPFENPEEGTVVLITHLDLTGRRGASVAWRASQFHNHLSVCAVGGGAEGYGMGWLEDESLRFAIGAPSCP